ncbi:RNA polymerase subunit sigma-70 [Mesorhizobium sp. BR1-1-16]|uniref:RNA polymerase sigma factor n=1 Tax=Mesorhizobium sp. BR1-1-16 TaxID=2876653 RepID=UPI001CCCCBAF|nr:DUF6596 domain-containing protein [Mesorhizobium sp. BR1-1-16]MBZ9934946.1 RNA polymerase subunit sigma-70 [Mesorhizobium sp. BR1-1-16]
MQPVEQAVRDSFGRLVAILASRGRDIAAAEDALADAVVAALQRWPESGVPDAPEAWLVAVARRRITDRLRKRTADAALERSLLLLSALAEETDPMAPHYPDERLKLMFVCAHPAIDEAIRAPLMLQTVLGLDASRIGAAFLVPAATMGQRLVRAKAKIRDAGIPFAVPERTELPARLASVIEAVYAAYGSGWDEIAGGAGARAPSLATEAIWLGRVLAALMPGDAEPLGLLALMLYCEARRPARRAPDGRYVPLSEQDTALWSREMLAEAELMLGRAAALDTPGRFQIEAAIQSALTGMRLIGRPDAAMIALLHEELWRRAPRIGVAVARAVAVADAEGATAGLALLAELEPERVAGYQPYHAAHAELLAQAGRVDEAVEAFRSAIALAEDPAIRAYLDERARRLVS